MNKFRIKLYPSPGCADPCSCVGSVEAAQRFLLPQLDTAQMWHFKDLMLGSQSCPSDGYGFFFFS